jgi:hypothetical protein
MKLGFNSFLWVVAFLLLVLSVVYFFSTIANLGSVEIVTKPAVPTVVGTVPTPTNFSGTVVKVDPLSVSYGTHRLVNDSGDVSAYLESRVIDLSILEGRKVIVEGKRERMVGPGIPLLDVEKVNLN